MNLINYIGIDNIESDEFIKKCTSKIEGTISIKENINDLLSFSVSHKNINYKCIDFFYDSNFEGESYCGNLFIINNSFELNFEYSLMDSPSKINLITLDIYDALNTTLENYYNESLDIKLFVSDLFCSIISENTIFYTINTTIYINEI